MNIGDIVRLNQSFLDEPTGCLAYVYNIESDGCYIITENGEDLGLFDKRQFKKLSYVCRSNFYYRFSTNEQLMYDWNDGLFLPAFNFVKG